jgi:hypothetical protein
MKYFIKSLLLLSLIILSCTKPNNKQLTSFSDTLVIRKVNLVRIQKQMLQGVWAKQKSEPALFLIQNDTLYYQERLDNPIPLLIEPDTLIIFGKPMVKCLIIKLTEDSLWLVLGDLQDTTKLYKRE